MLLRCLTMLPLFAVIVPLLVCDLAYCQLIRSSLPNDMAVERRSAIPAKLGASASLHFRHLDLLFDGGSQVAVFQRNDEKRLEVWFPHKGYWTDVARKKSLQPVAVSFMRGDTRGLAEIVRDSPLEKKLIELISRDLTAKGHSQSALQTLRLIHDTIRTRKPLKGDEWETSP